MRFKHERIWIIRIILFFCTCVISRSNNFQSGALQIILRTLVESNIDFVKGSIGTLSYRFIELNVESSFSFIHCKLSSLISSFIFFFFFWELGNHKYEKRNMKGMCKIHEKNFVHLQALISIRREVLSKSSSRFLRYQIHSDKILEIFFLLLLFFYSFLPWLKKSGLRLIFARPHSIFIQTFLIW